MKVTLTVENQEINFEIDTGSPISAIPEKLFKENESFSNLQLNHTDRKFRSYSGTSIIPLGILKVNVQVRKHYDNFKLLMISGTGGPIVGRE